MQSITAKEGTTRELCWRYVTNSQFRVFSGNAEKWKRNLFVMSGLVLP